MSYSRNFDLNLGLGYDTDEGNDPPADTTLELDVDDPPADNTLELDDDDPPAHHEGERDSEYDGDQTDGSAELLAEDDQPTENENAVVVPPPYNGMTFPTVGEFTDYCHAYAQANGFQIRIRSSQQQAPEKTPEGEADRTVRLRRLRFVCTKAGTFKSRTRSPAKGSISTATRCGFRVGAYLQNGGGLWLVSGVVLEHNHECLPKNSTFLKNYRFINEGNKQRILDNDRAGVPIPKNFSSFVVQHGHHANVPFEEKDLRNLVGKSRRLHLQKGDFVEMRKLFDDMSSSNSNFFYSYDLDDDNRLRNVFWADGRCRAAYMEFGDVISFDTTYVSNRYKFPFAPFVGVNNHGQSILFGCALLGGEEIANFVWLFRTWLACMSNKAPTAILTDQCRSIGLSVFSFFNIVCLHWF